MKLDILFLLLKCGLLGTTQKDHPRRIPVSSVEREPTVTRTLTRDSDVCKEMASYYLGWWVYVRQKRKEFYPSRRLHKYH